MFLILIFFMLGYSCHFTFHQNNLFTWSLENPLSEISLYLNSNMDSDSDSDPPIEKLCLDASSILSNVDMQVSTENDSAATSEKPPLDVSSRPSNMAPQVTTDERFSHASIGDVRDIDASTSTTNYNVATGATLTKNTNQVSLKDSKVQNLVVAEKLSVAGEFHDQGDTK
jgi:hypothetical protein